MAISRKRALSYAEEILAVPRSHVRVVLRQGKLAVSLLYRGRVLTKCYINRVGIQSARFMAQALGMAIPPLGQTVEAVVSTGVLWRAVSISTLDLRNKVSFLLLERYLEEAQMMRETGGGPV